MDIVNIDLFTWKYLNLKEYTWDKLECISKY